MPYGLGSSTSANPATAAPPVQPQFYLSTNSYGETFWDFLDHSSDLGISDFLYKYRVAIGVGGALFLGSLMFFRKGSTN